MTRWPILLFLTGCATNPGTPSPSAAFRLPDSVVVLDATDGRRIDANELLTRLAGADIALLGELHDNAVHHEVRGGLLAALASRRPAIVFEQFAETAAPIATPEAGRATEEWLDRNGFDRESWKWPLHRPIVDAAIQHAGSLWGSGISRDAHRSVIRDGESASPPHLRALLEQAPLDVPAMATLDRELVEGHCGQLPEAMVPGMRAAQTVRDAAMTRALLSARAASQSAWLIAGNGHVRRDIAVPRLLRVTSPDLSVVVVGFVEQRAGEGEVSAETRAFYDLVVVTPRVERPDPCAAFRRR